MNNDTIMDYNYATVCGTLCMLEPILTVVKALFLCQVWRPNSKEHSMRFC